MKIKKEVSSNTREIWQFIASVLESFILSAIYLLFWKIFYEKQYFANFTLSGNFIIPLIYAVLLITIFKSTKACRFASTKTMNIAMCQLISIGISGACLYVLLCLISNSIISIVPMIYTLIAQVTVAGLITFLCVKLFYALRPRQDMVLIYGTDNAVGLKLKLDSMKDKYNIEKLISVTKGLDYIISEISDYQAVVLNDLPSQIRNDILKYCYSSGKKVYMVPKITDIIARGAQEVNLTDTPLLVIQESRLTPMQNFAKRALDLLICSVAMFFIAPVMFAVAIAIKVEDGGPVFYKQKRLTINNKEFEILKFRSMIPDAEKYTGAVLADENDPRITKVGKIIRATRLDEIPQILNILKGEMSIVGPRPERKKFVDEFCQEIPEFAYRMKVKGGLTGYAQVYGKYNTNPYDKLRLDLMYIENYSLWLDIKLMFLTVWVIFSKDSTEGIDVAKENEEKLNSILEDIHTEEEKKD